VTSVERHVRSTPKEQTLPGHHGMSEMCQKQLVRPHVLVSWVKAGKAQCDQMTSAIPPEADIAAPGVFRLAYRARAAQRMIFRSGEPPDRSNTSRNERRSLNVITSQRVARMRAR